MTKIRAIKGYTDVIAKADVCGRTFYAEAKDRVIDGEAVYFATVFEDREGEADLNGICSIKFDPGVGGSAVMKILRGVLLGVSSHYGHARRRRERARQKKLGLCLTPEQELAATIRRQKEIQ